jgi:hypothetical protein
MTIEPPYSAAEFTPAEARAFMLSWWRVVERDGSTVAYVPDRATAVAIRAALEKPAEVHP